jgi:hypothetical protein
MKKSGSTGNKDSLAGVSEQADFVIESTGTYYYVFAKKTDKTDFNDLVSKIVSYNEEYFQFDNLRANTMMSNDGYQLLYVREFQDYAKVIKYIKDMEALNYIQKVFQIQSDYVHFGISPGNFKKMLKEQKLEAYSKLFKEKFAKEKAAKP